MKNFSKYILFFILVLGLSFISSQPAYASNDCKRIGCQITITLNIVFVGATQDQINKWVNEIESTWDSPTTGKCTCDVSFIVSAKTAPSCTHQSAQGSHCIEVTATLPKDNNNKEYPAFMWGISQNGSSINGKFWADTSRTIPGPFTVGTDPQYTPTAGETFKDAAHEAGHMLGLGDDYNAGTGTYGNSLMGKTWGPNAKPNQGQIDQAVSNNCKGEDAKCPDECCCGRNGKVDTDPKEECDPSAQPTGCGENQSCDKNCKCVGMKATPICGDGYVTKPEEDCEPGKKPTGCASDEDCVGCKCKKKPAQTPPTTPGAAQPPIINTNTNANSNTNINQTPGQSGSVTLDKDNDGIVDSIDNCPNISNHDQADKDNDKIGDLCDPCTDIDHDTYSKEGGNCGEVDCNDYDPSISPGKLETIDKIDNDCDGLIDEQQQVPTCGDGLYDPAIEGCDSSAAESGCPQLLICSQCMLCLPPN